MYITRCPLPLERTKTKLIFSYKLPFVMNWS